MKELIDLDYKLLRSFFNLATSVSDELFEEICSHLRKKTFAKGESILNYGDIETRTNIVSKGIVHQFVYDEDVSMTINLTPKGLPFNSLKSYIEGSASREVHEAITDVELLYIEKQDLENLAKKNHEFSYVMYKIHEHILLDRENRMILLQYRNPAKRYKLFHEIVDRSNWLLDGTPDKYIAGYLNMTPQQYSKEKKRNKQKKIMDD